MIVRMATAVALAACLLLAGCGGSKKVHLEGKRISVLELEKTLTPDPRLESTPISLPAPFDNPAWPGAGGYSNHAMYHLALPPDIRRAWTANVGEGAWRYGRVTAQPIIASGRVFAMDANDVISAFDARNGDRLWRFDPQPKNDDEPMFGGGIAYADGRIFAATGYAQVVALDAASGKRSGARISPARRTGRRRRPMAASSPSPSTTSSKSSPRRTAIVCGHTTAFRSRRIS